VKHSLTRRRARHGRLLVAGIAVTCVAGFGAVAAAVTGTDPFGTSQVGQKVNSATLLPTNQWVSPLGHRTLVKNGRLVSSTLSPDGQTLAALSWNDFTGYLTLVDVKDGTIRQQVGTGSSSDPTLGDATVGADGPYYSPDGKTLWMGQSSDLVKFSVNPDGTVSAPTVVPLPTNGPGGAALPSGMAFSSDGSTAYVALNGYNTLAVLDTATNTITKQIPVGNAPRQVIIDGNEAYVSNEGGRPANSGDFTNVSDGTAIVSNRSTGGAITGTVSIVDLSAGKQVSSIAVGLQPTAMYLNSADGALFVANSNDDSVSIINTGDGSVAQTIHVNPVPGATVGSYANAISMPDANHVLISIGRDNAIADYRYNGLSGGLQFLGLIPTDWYPVQVQPDSALGNKIVVTNDKGIGARGPCLVECPLNKGPYTQPAKHPVTGHNTYNDTGSVTTFQLPADNQLSGYTQTVFTDNAWNHIPADNSGQGDTVPKVIPPKIGGSSKIKHVFVIVKENRTYDQVLGDLGEGNGDPALTQFGAKVTPNEHALAQRFGDLDNFYDEGTLSADGHNWIVQAEANDYVEKEFGAFYRSYPAQGGDALAYQRDGFIWNAAEKAGLSVKDYGEYANFFTVPSSQDNWSQWYRDSQILEGKAKGPLPIPINEFRTYADIPSLNAIMNPFYPKFDTSVPDQYRVDIWLRDFKKDEQSGKLPNLTLMWVPDDHTGGPPDPVAQVADNDLATGRIVDAVSHSKFWKSTAIFVLEDDPQNGVDHVDGHRSVLWVASPYSKSGVNDNYYSQIDVVRTVEQMLGIQPMNQEDLAATPMYSAFTSTPNFAPYNAQPNQIPLTLGVPGYPSTMAKQAGTNDATLAKAEAVPASQRRTYNAWMAWSRRQHFTGRHAVEDFAKPALLNRLDWYAAHNWRLAYPGDSRIFAPNRVPGRNLPADLLGDG
jgi:YVTN family beta-propeller protein